MRHILRSSAHTVTFLFLALGTSVAQVPAAQDETMKQVQQRLRDGQLDQALALARKAADDNPASVQANTQAGVILDLQGHYTAARRVPREGNRGGREPGAEIARVQEHGDVVRVRAQL